MKVEKVEERDGDETDWLLDSTDALEKDRRDEMAKTAILEREGSEYLLQEEKIGELSGPDYTKISIHEIERGGEGALKDVELVTAGTYRGDGASRKEAFEEPYTSEGASWKGVLSALNYLAGNHSNHKEEFYMDELD